MLKLHVRPQHRPSTRSTQGNQQLLASPPFHHHLLLSYPSITTTPQNIHTSHVKAVFGALYPVSSGRRFLSMIDPAKLIPPPFKYLYLNLHVIILIYYRILSFLSYLYSKYPTTLIEQACGVSVTVTAAVPATAISFNSGTVSVPDGNTTNDVCIWRRSRSFTRNNHAR